MFQKVNQSLEPFRLLALFLPRFLILSPSLRPSAPGQALDLWGGTSGIPCPDSYPKGSIGCIGRFMPQLKAKDPDFKASLRWYQKWKRCHCISLRTKNNPCTVSSEQFRGTNSEVPSVCHTSTSVLRILLGKDL